MGVEMVMQAVEGGRVSGAKPVGTRGEFLHPCAGGGDDEATAGSNQFGEAGEEFRGVVEAAEEIRCEDDVKLAEILAQIHGITRFKGDPVAVDIERHAGGAFRGAGALLQLVKPVGAVFL